MLELWTKIYGGKASLTNARRAEVPAAFSLPEIQDGTAARVFGAGGLFVALYLQAGLHGVRILAPLTREPVMEIEAYCDQQDRVILNDIINGTISRAVLVDKSGWKRICQVRARNMSKVDSECWKRLCLVRGEAGPPAGPYE